MFLTMLMFKIKKMWSAWINPKADDNTECFDEIIETEPLPEQN